MTSTVIPPILSQVQQYKDNFLKSIASAGSNTPFKQVDKLIHYILEVKDGAKKTLQDKEALGTECLSVNAIQPLNIHDSITEFSGMIDEIHQLQVTDYEISDNTKKIRDHLKAFASDRIHYTMDNRVAEVELIQQFSRYNVLLEEEAADIERLAQNLPPTQATTLLEEANALRAEISKNELSLAKRKKVLRKFQVINGPGVNRTKLFLKNLDKIEVIQRKMDKLQSQLANSTSTERIQMLTGRLEYYSSQKEFLLDEGQWILKQTDKRCNRTARELGGMVRMFKYQFLGDNIAAKAMKSLLNAQKNRREVRCKLLESLQSQFDDTSISKGKAVSQLSAAVHAHTIVPELMFGSADMVEHSTHILHDIVEVSAEVAEVGAAATQAAALSIGPTFSGLGVLISSVLSGIHGWKYMKTKQKLQTLQNLKETMDTYFQENPEMKEKISNELGYEFFNFLNEEITEEKLDHATQCLGSGLSALGFSVLVGTPLIIGGTTLAPVSLGAGFVLAGVGISLSIGTLANSYLKKDEKKRAKILMQHLDSALCSAILKEKKLVQTALIEGVPPPELLYSRDILKYLKKDEYTLLVEVLESNPIVKSFINS